MLVLPTTSLVFVFEYVIKGSMRGDPLIMRLLVHIRCCIARDIAADIDAHDECQLPRLPRVTSSQSSE
jgi:hypothetical protein